MAQAAAERHPDRTAAKKKPGLASEAGRFGPTTKAADQPRVRERIMKLS
jgi:hypothetical protein